MTPHRCLLVVALTAGLAACGGDAEPTVAPPSASSGSPTQTGTGAARATPAPAPSDGPAARQRSALRRNHADANRFIGDGRDALDERLASLEGVPVVVNTWASWCGPCRAEFPFFAAAAKRHDAKVAFVGVNVTDSRDSAQAFLEERSPGFASVFDADGKAARSLGADRAMPMTLFLDRDGKVVHAKLGGYATAELLEADIRRYARGAA